jgi:hypothetical protein
MKKTIAFLFGILLVISCSTSSDGNGNSTTTVVPVPPTNLTGTASSPTQINLSWTDNSTNETGFKIQRRIGDENYTIVGNANTDELTFSDTGLEPSTTYVYRVYSYNTDGNSPTYSNEVTVTTRTEDRGIGAVSTAAVSSIAATTAVSGGYIDITSGAIIAKGVCWSTITNPTISLPTKTNNGAGSGFFTSNLTSLTANTTYYVRAYAKNNSGTRYGNQVSFTTSTPASLPTLITTTVSSITSTTALSGGAISSDGGAAITAKGVCWSTSTNPSLVLSSGRTINGTGIGAFSSNLTGLTANTTYYVRAYATNIAGTAYGNEFSFRTD